jgi:phosphonate degradation associated HDIG domain protein
MAAVWTGSPHRGQCNTFHFPRCTGTPLASKKSAVNQLPEPLEILRVRGAAAYVGEPVTIAAHCLQTAALAASAGASDALIVAALLHDIGHLLHSAGADATDRGIDPRHEVIGARFLRPRLGPAVSEPVRLHVAAKRYLCATAPAYAAGLSQESVGSLGLQGGPFTADAAREFLAQPYAPEAVRLRLWDDEAKVKDLVVPSLETYQRIVESLSQAALTPTQHPDLYK